MEMVEFCMKIAGSGCILMSGTLAGWSSGEKIEKRYRSLNELRRGFHMIYGDISYGANSLVEVIQHVKEQSKYGCREVFAQVEGEMKGKTKRKFVEIWNGAIDMHEEHMYLNERDICELRRMGENIGSIDREQQLSMVKLYLVKLEQAITELEKEKENKVKLYRMLGILGSVFVVVILF